MATFTPSGSMSQIFQDRDRANLFNDRAARYAFRKVAKGIPYRYAGTVVVTVTEN